LGEARGEAWQDVIVKHADGWNSVPASPEGLASKLEALRAACRRAGRDFAELELSLEIQILIQPTEAEVKSTARRIAALPPSKRGQPRNDILALLEAADERPLSSAVNDWLVGAPRAVTAQIETYRDMGIQHFMLWFLDYPSLDGMRLFAETVMPAFTRTGD
jgi:alkanesulfonate monooxygenase SsuD/methylene tetrahydromethanopterin reductase-like flavin-dependent oxidoreductase (luciferase family)